MRKLLVGALVATLVGVGLAYRFRGARKERLAPLPPGLPGNVDQQVSGYTYTRSDAGRKVFTVRAARSMALKQGNTTVLEDVVVELFGRKGDRHDVLKTQRAEYNSQSGDFSSPGTTVIELNAPPDLLPGSSLRGSQPVHLETSGVFYHQQESLMVNDNLVRFTVGHSSGSAKGIRYATRDGWLELEKDVRADWHPGGSQPAIRLAATHLRYDKATGRVTLDGPLELSKGTSRVEARGGTITLDNHSRLTGIALDGAVRVSLNSDQGSETSSLRAMAEHFRGDLDPASGALRAAHAEGGVKAELRRGRSAGKPESVAELVAQNADVIFRGARPVPEKGAVSGNARLTIVARPTPAPAEGADNSPTTLARATSETKILTASEIDFGFRPDGRSVEEAKTVGQGKLVLVPEDPHRGRREITAGQFVMGFDTQDRLESVSGNSGAQLVQQPPAGAPLDLAKQESSSDRLRATLDPATEAIQAIEQTGHFSLIDGNRHASAERADYSPQGQMLTMTGDPQVWDPVTRIKAERFLLHLDTDTAEGIGKVQATHLDAPAAAPRAAGGVARTEPDSQASTARATTNVLADRVLARRRDQFLHYEGHVRAWHGADVIESSSLDYYGQQRRVSSNSSVLTSHLAATARAPGRSSTPASSQQATRPLTIRADHLEYFDEGRKADYRGNVELKTESTTLRADRLEVYFSASSAAGGSQVERVVADGHVRVSQPQRHATGDHADYEAASGKITMKGGSPSLYDDEQGFTTGQSLTFFIRDDRLTVDGGEKSPTLSKRRITQ